MDRDIAVVLLDQLHAAQNEFCGGGGDALPRDLLALTSARQFLEQQHGRCLPRHVGPL
jgi:hypothetical protein